MDRQFIDEQYGQLQQQVQQTTGEISALAEKLKAAAQSGDEDAREWMLDLKEIALAIQAGQKRLPRRSRPYMPSAPLPHEQQSPWGGAPSAQPWSSSPQPVYPQQQHPRSTGGRLVGLMNSGSARAVAMGAIFGSFGRRGL
jgi:hypothetical protein